MRGRHHPVLLGGLMAVVLSGCASGGMAPVIESSTAADAPTPPLPPAAPLAAEPAGPSDSGDAIVKPLREGASIESELPAPELPAPEPSVVEPANPAVVALLNTAGEHSRAGRHDSAAASLERALQIEPRNAWLWHRLALSRLAQGEAEQAEQLAAKSNSLAAQDRKLLADNWLLIAEARRQRGDLAGALDAEIRANEAIEGG